MTYKHILGAAKKTNQLNLNEVISKRFKHNKNGWVNLKIENIDMNSLLSCIGGNLDYTRFIEYHINHNITVWAFDRLVYSVNRNRWEYIAGQDGTAELNNIRKILRGK